MLGDYAPFRHVTETNHFRWNSLEQDLVTWWLQQSGKQVNLKTIEGEYLIVLNAGHINDGPGPDILDCHLILADRELAGSVEMHRAGKDWYRHGHDKDQRYERVILHVVNEVAGGPDLPTLKVQSANTGAALCLAQHPVSAGEMRLFAKKRFLRKVEHWQSLKGVNVSLNPFLLGLAEIQLAGPGRQAALHEVAVGLGLEEWPDSRPWVGSRQIFSRRHSRMDLILTLFQQSDQLDLQLSDFTYSHMWRDWNAILHTLNKLGVSRNQGREWVINILAPAMGFTAGFGLWLRLPPFRQYGVERRLKNQLGISQTKCIANQQAILEWATDLCGPGNCSMCPLVRSHHTLGWVD